MRSESVYARVDPLATRPRDREYVRVSLQVEGGDTFLIMDGLALRAPR